MRTSKVIFFSFLTEAIGKKKQDIRETDAAMSVSPAMIVTTYEKSIKSYNQPPNPGPRMSLKIQLSLRYHLHFISAISFHCISYPVEMYVLNSPETKL